MKSTFIFVLTLLTAVCTHAVTITSAFYIDEDGDGFIDKINISFSHLGPEAVYVEELIAYMELPASRSFTTDMYGYESSQSFTLDVTELETTPNSAVTDDDVLELRAGVMSSGAVIEPAYIQIEDKMAPIILNAAVKAGTEGAKDTLVTQFSETISQDDQVGEHFRCFNGQGEVISLSTKYLMRSGDMELFEVVSGAFEEGDSIAVNAQEGLISDLHGNKQMNQLNCRVPLLILTPPVSLSSKSKISLASPVQAVGRTLKLEISDDYSLELFSLSGERVLRRELSRYETSFILPHHISAGTYITSIDVNGKKISGKIVITE